MSASFGTPSVKMMFDGLMSRCVSPCVCNASNASVNEIPRRIDSSADNRFWRPRSLFIVRQLHAVIEIFVRAADVQDIDEPGMPARDRLEGGHSFELTQERPLALKRAPINNFHRAECAGDRPRQPNLAISAAPDHA